MTDYLIIGGGIAAVTAAETIRSRDAAGSIRIYGDEKHALYSRVLLPHVVRGKTPEDKAFLRQPGALADKRIEYVMGERITSVDPAAHTVTLASGETVTYGKLLIATGGAVKPLNIPGADAAGVIPFQTLDDARALIAARETAKAVVYGAGFIALELIMSFRHHGASVTGVIRNDGYFSRVLSPEAKTRIAETLVRNGVEIVSGTEITGFETTGALKKLKLSNGSELTCTAVAAGIGIAPNVAFLAGSGIEIGTGVLTDEFLRTGTPDVWAAGDVAESFDRALGTRRMAGNWQNAMFQGKHAGENMTAPDANALKPYEAVTAYTIAVFDLPLAFMGAVDAPGAERVLRVTPKGALLHIYVKNGRAVGAACVGPFAERAAVTKLLQSPQLPADLDAVLFAA